MMRHLLATAAACCAAAGAILAAQQTAPPRPTFKSEANYIRVDAFVTSDGRPVEDLRAEDFELFEDGKPQKIDAFEFVRIAPAGPDATRVEPHTQEAANQMAADPRARVFVVFLDVDHVPVDGSYRLKSALATMLSRMLAPEDLVGIITSRNSPSELILARKTAVLQEQLDRYWYWGRRDTIDLQPEEQEYLNCYQRYEGGEALAYELIDRRREKMTLDALKDLVIHLRGLRDERKAVLAVTTGWRLFRPDRSLERPLTDAMGRQHVPQGPPIVVGPGGKIMSGEDPRLAYASMSKCDRDRMELANIDDWQDFRDLGQDANRANVTFYPIDPRGLVVFDAPIGPRKPPPPSLDAAILRGRHDSLRTLADQTDGIAVVDTDVTAGLRRVSADLSSYYLIGYYSSNTGLDGKYHTISVRTKRPGAQVRARRGYRAATRDEVARGAALTGPAPGSNSVTTAAQDAVRTALNRLALIRPDAALYVHATHASGGPVWVSGEIPAAAARAAWAKGARASIVAVDRTGATVGVARKEIAPGERDFVVAVPLDDATKTPARIQLRVEGEGNTPIGLEVAPQSGDPLLLRRSGALPPHAAADFRFFRTEALVYRWPLGPGEQPESGRVLDRTGSAMTLTVAPAEQAIDGARWLAGSLALAPLTNGDYLLELTKKTASGRETRLVPFRIVR